MRRSSSWVLALVLAGAPAPARAQALAEAPSIDSGRVLEVLGTSPSNVYEGRVTQETSGAASIQIDKDPALAIPIAKPVLPKEMGALEPARVRLAVEAGPDMARVKVQDVELGAVARWKDSAISSEPRFRELNESCGVLEDMFESIKQRSIAGAQWLPFREALDGCRRRVADEYVAAAQRADQKVLLRYLRDLRTTGKTVFGRDDQYPPLTYLRIFERSRSAVGVGFGADPRPRCSGFLVGRDLVVTAAHCVADVTANDVFVRFNYEEGMDGTVVYKVARIAVDGRAEDGVDAALLELIPKSGSVPGDSFEPLCLSSERAMLDDPVYLVGHPLRHPRTVHDHAYVTFPFEVTTREFGHLVAEVAAELDGLPDRETLMAELEKSYRWNSATSKYEYYSMRWQSQPTIGIDSDTFHGDSGSPMLNRRNQLVVGVFFDGQADTTLGLPPGWRYHEAVLPITKVIDYFDRAWPDWKSHRVCIDGEDAATREAIEPRTLLTAVKDSSSCPTH